MGPGQRALASASVTARPAGRASESHPLVGLQRRAGNRAVNAALVRRVQRKTKGDPAVLAAHVLTDAERADMPSEAETPGLVTELKSLNAKAKTEKLTPDDEKRRKELETKLGSRRKGDEERTLEYNKVPSTAAEWFADVKSGTFLGRRITVHKSLAERLQKAEDALKGQPVPNGGWVQGSVSTLRGPGEGLHSFGLAIDLNVEGNPYLLNAKAGVEATGAKTNKNAFIRGVIERAVLLVLNRTAAEENFQARPKVDDKDKRVEASYDKVAEASKAMARYFELADPTQRSELDRLAAACLPKDPKKRTADAWAKTIAADRKAIPGVAKSKSWTKPEQGFLQLDKRLVLALTASNGAGLTWLGDDTIASGRDIMHFDMRGVGPIRRIWSSTAGKVTGLGSG